MQRAFVSREQLAAELHLWRGFTLELSLIAVVVALYFAVGKLRSSKSSHSALPASA